MSSKNNGNGKDSKISSDNTYDVVIIGTGMGGSAAGAVSALHGLKTLVLEKNPRPGGACSYYEKQGFRMDTGTHLFIRANKGPFGKLTRRLGMGYPIEFIQSKKTVEIKGINIDAIIPKNLLLRAMVMPKLAWQSKINPIHYPSILRLFHSIARMKQPEIEKLDNVSIEEFMCRFTDNSEIQTMIGGLLGLFFILPAWEASAGESIWNLQKLLWEDNLSYPKGGCSVIPETFLKGAKNHGAEVRMKAGVKKIEVEDGKIGNIILDSGDKIKARAVISTTSVYDTICNLVGEDYFPEPYVQKVKDIKPSWTAVQAKIAVKKKLLTAGSLIGGLPLKCDKKLAGEYAQEVFKNAEVGKQGGLVPIYAPVPTNFDESLAPPGCQIITAVALAPTLDVEFQDDHDVWIDGMMKALYEMVPGLEDNILFNDTWSVPTLASWIGKSNGSAITTGQAVNQVRVQRPSHQTAVKGLYIAGDGAGMTRGVGTELACQSGVDCADLVAHDFANYLV